MKKIVINVCYGGFGLSAFAMSTLKDRLGLSEEDSLYDWEIERDDPRLVSLVEEFGTKKCSGPHSDLRIVEIPDDVEKWVIEKYDGAEHVAEFHRTWS